MKMNLELINPNPLNPRTITEDAFNRLVEKIKRRPEILEAKPLVIAKGMLEVMWEDDKIKEVVFHEKQEYYILGGNQRYRAVKQLGYTEVPVFDATSWSADTMREFIVIDNINEGEWNFSDLFALYQGFELKEMGFSQKQLGIDIDYNNIDEEWNGMPEVNAERIEGAVQSLIIHFESQEDIKDFMSKTGLKITEKTKSTWFPFKEKEAIKDYVVKNES